MKLDYRNLFIDRLAIFYVGEPNSVRDMSNYIYYHEESGIQLSTMIQRAKINHLYFYVSHACPKRRNWIGLWIVKHRLKSAGLLLSSKEFVSAVICVRPEKIMKSIEMSSEEKAMVVKLAAEHMQCLFRKA